MVYALEFKRNPFKPPAEINFMEKSSNENNTYSIKLTGIIWDKKEPSAVLKMGRFKKIITIGDIIKNNKVTQITKKHILLVNETNKESKIMLKLGEELRL